MGRAQLTSEAPRLTGMLRVRLTGQGEASDPHRVVLERNALIRRKKAEKEAKEECDGQRLTWTFLLSAREVSYPPKELKALREAYDSLLSAVARVIGPDRPSDELLGAAFYVWDMLSAGGERAEAEAARNHLGSVFGPVSADVFGALEGATRELVRRKNDAERVCSATKEQRQSTSDALEEHEFGWDMPFSANSPSVLDDVKDNVEPRCDLVRSVPSAQRPVKRGKEEETEESGVDLSWLRSRCHDHVMRMAQGGGGFTAEELFVSVLSSLQSDKSDDALQMELFDLLGAENLDTISTLLTHRSGIMESARYAAAGRDREGRPLQTNLNAKRGQSYGPQVTVQSQFDKFMDKQRRKEERREARRQKNDGQEEGEIQLSWLLAMGMDTAALRLQREIELQEATVAHSWKSLNLAPAVKREGLGLGGRKMALPEGTVRKTYDGYEEVRIPAQHQPSIKGERLVEICELEDWAQLAFKGMRTLNRIQSRLFATAFNSNENILLCAPTGAGKTNVAMLCILHELSKHIHDGTLRKEDFKVIYVAPMKALAAEMVQNFGKRLNALGVVVRELTGDTQLTKREVLDTQMIVTTPEKWDVITRKSNDSELAKLVKLLIIDEVHLLNDGRGPVIETLVARTLRQVEATQSMIRIVGLSATLPNYVDVAVFLRVNPKTGLFYFDNAWRPVPLQQQYIGVTDTNPMRKLTLMNEICLRKVVENLKMGHQVMVFVHSRKDTGATARALREMAGFHGEEHLFACARNPRFGVAQADMAKSRNKELRELFPDGFGIHHAGMLRSDRTLVEKLFREGLIKVLCCTATLAWGINMPAHTVIIKGTEIYNAEKGGFVELGILDVMQIFGRAGRPQYDTSGEGIIITTHGKLDHYLQLMNHQLPIESQLINRLPDNLNAEVVLGTVSNVKEAVSWLTYSYLYIRMMRNPLAYGISWDEKQGDPMLEDRRTDLIAISARTLDKCRMLRFDEHTGTLSMTDWGRIASHYYIQHETIELYNEEMRPNMSEPELFSMLARSHEFENLKIRDEEVKELTDAIATYCPIQVKGGPENNYGKTNILLQCYISQARLESFTLISDTAFVVQNAARLMRGIFEIALRRGWSSLCSICLEYCKVMDRRMWGFQHPLRQFPTVSYEVISKLEDRNVTLDRLYDMEANEIGHIIHHPRYGQTVSHYVRQFPYLSLEVAVQPITRSVLRVHLNISAEFDWNDHVHRTVEPWWIFVEDDQNEHIYHHEYFLLYKKTRAEPHTLTFTIPIFEPLPPQYFIRAVSDRWIGAEITIPMSFRQLILPHKHVPHTELLDLEPLPTVVLENEGYERIYSFTHFNPIQTQTLFTAYHTDANILLGAPTGSGKTVVAELAMLRLFNAQPKGKVVYIGPLKALVRERIKDWRQRFQNILKRRVVELTGDYTPDIRTLNMADIVCTTPEKWDGISRNWQNRGYVKQVGLVVIDEIHLLGDERGPILEVIVSRMRYISSQTDSAIRFVGLSTALANARDLADWLGINEMGLFNFRPSVRPVPLEVHIAGFSGKHYCPRMATMNKPTYAAIQSHSPVKPTLVFVSSRRQTRLTAFDLIAFAAADEAPKQFIHLTDSELQHILMQVRDSNLKHTISFGIGLHHAGLAESDRTLVEELFARNKIQVLVSTATLAWGVNLPAHLVVVKGTEFYDGKTKRYVDYPITDVLQMMGRAGRPQFDQNGKAVILVHEPKKNFYKKFLYEPFPVESNLPEVLHDHINAEIVGGTITTPQDAIDYLTWTYFFRRLLVNPSYYSLEDADTENVNSFLSNLVNKVVTDLQGSGCIDLEEGEDGTVGLVPLTLGRIASYYYLHHTTVRLFSDLIEDQNDMDSLLDIVANAPEYDELPVRHNEDKMNGEMATEARISVPSYSLDSPHTKCHLLLQFHFSRMSLPISDYVTDTKSVLDQAIRIMQAMVDVAADNGWLETSLSIMNLMQCIMQGVWWDGSSLLVCPHFDEELVRLLNAQGVECLPELMNLDQQDVRRAISGCRNARQIEEVCRVLAHLPLVTMKWSLAESTVTPGQEVDVEVSLERVNGSLNKRAYTPRHPKPKEEGWWLVLGDCSANELLALKRVSFRASTTVHMTLTAPERQGMHTITLFLLSDCYVGLDQQYDMDVMVTPD